MLVQVDPFCVLAHMYDVPSALIAKRTDEKPCRSDDWFLELEISCSCATKKTKQNTEVKKRVPRWCAPPRGK